MKIVLCPVPLSNPIAVMGESPKIHNALALGCIASALKANKATENEEVIILDREALLHNLDMLKEDILKEQPDVLGISVYIWNYQRVMHLCSMVNQVNPDITIVLGGPQVTYNAEEVLKDNPSVDIIVRGEGEITFCQLIETLKKKENKGNQRSSLKSVRGISFRHHGQIIHTQKRPPVLTLDEIPSPYLTGVLDLSLSELLELETSRGCPYRCAYCIWHRVHKNLCLHSMERVFEQLKFAYDKGIKKVVFWDSVFDLPERGKALCDYVFREGLDLHMTIFLNPWTINPEYLDLLGKTGTFLIDLGVQSMNPETLRLINRSANVDRTKKALTFLKERELEVVCDVILGLPAEPLKSVTAAMDLISKMGFGISVNILQLLPGSLLYETAREHGLVHMAEPPYMVYETSFMSKKELATAFRYGHYVQQRETIRKIIQSGKPERQMNPQRKFDSFFGG